MNTTKKSPTKKASAQETSPAAPVSAKKSPAPKTAPKKTSAPKKTVTPTKKTVAKKETPVTETAPKKSSKKVSSSTKTPSAKKSAPVQKTAQKTSTSKTDAAAASREGVKMLGILHIVGNILSGGTLGILLVLGYLFFKKTELSSLERETCYEIINFNLSFIIYSCIAGVLVFLLIGFVLLPLVVVTWIVLMIMGFLEHLQGKNYKYPFVIRFVS